MANTTNYNWETPDDTDLVKDGAAAIRTLGSSIDSTVFTNASNAINKTIVDAKGDLIAATAADTVARLAVGANGTVLTANSATATGLEWGTVAAGANWSLLNAGGTALTGAATITVSGISNRDKIMVLVDFGSSANASSTIRLRVNTLSTSIYYYFGNLINPGAAYASSISTVSSGIAQTSIDLAFMASDVASVVQGGITLTGCASAGVKQFQSVFAATPASASGQINLITQGYIDTSASITSISLISSSGNFDNGSVFVYTSA